MLVWEFHFENAVTYLTQIYIPCLFLYAPMLYLYTISVVRQPKNMHVLNFHFLPAGIILLYIMVKFAVLPWNDPASMLRDDILLYPIKFSVIRILLWTQFLLYSFLCFQLLWQFHNRLKIKSSSLQNISYSWLSFLVIGFIIWKAVFLTGYMYFAVGNTKYYNLFRTFIELGFLAYSTTLVYKAISFPSIFANLNFEKKYKNSPLTEMEMSKILDMLKNQMAVNKPYLSPEYSLKELSASSGIPQHHISQVLSNKLGTNFYDFVNRYRIEESLKWLKSKDSEDKNILEILYEVGFNSKSVFNSSFRRFIGTTPSEYKKMQSESKKCVSLN
jgi:AraC-like DNA-binding protein